MKKRFLAILLAAIFVFGMSACKKDTVPADAGAEILEGEITEEAAKEILTELIPKAVEINNIFHGAGLETKDTESKEAGYYPVSEGSPYQTVAELKTATESAYALEFAQANFYAENIDGENPMFKDVEGVLSTSVVAGMAPEITWDIETTKIGYQIGDTLVLYLNAAYPDTESFPGMLALKKEGETWKMASGLSSTNQPEEFKAEGDITMDEALEALYAMPKEELKLEGDISEYYLVFDSFPVDSDGKLFYGITAYAKLKDSMMPMGYYLIPMSGADESSLLPKVSANYNWACPDGEIVADKAGVAKDYLAAIGYLGYFPGGDIQNVAKDYAASGLLDMPEIVEYLGDEYYVIIPKYEGTTITIREIIEKRDEDNNYSYETGKILISSQSPIVFSCNLSELRSNVEITVSDGENEVVFSPYLKLETSVMSLVDEIKDISVYPDMQKTLKEYINKISGERESKLPDGSTCVMNVDSNFKVKETVYRANGTKAISSGHITAIGNQVLLIVDYDGLEVGMYDVSLSEGGFILQYLLGTSNFNLTDKKDAVFTLAE